MTEEMDNILRKSLDELTEAEKGSGLTWLCVCAASCFIFGASW
jgi:hypothetical protein